MPKLSKLGKKSKRKWATTKINQALVKVPATPLQDYYQRAVDCTSLLYQEGITISGRYCNCRTCLTCSAIRTAKYIKHYSNQLLEFQEPVLVTLTQPTIQATNPEQLREQVERMLHVWRLIYKQSMKAKAKKAGIRLAGIRALEITQRPDNFYHAHFHYSLDGRMNGEWLVKQWLSHYPDAAPWCQDIRPIVNEEGLLEVLKYATKFVGDELVETEEVDEDGVVRKVLVRVRKREDPVRTDLVIRAIRGKQLIGAFGGVRKIEIEDVNAVVQQTTYEELKHAEYRVWRWQGHDWYSHDEERSKMTTFEPSEAMRKIFE
jgi:hypothetical protein